MFLFFWLSAWQLASGLTPLQWFNAKHPVTWQKVEAIEYAVVADWDGNKQYKTHVWVSDGDSNAGWHDYEIRLGRYTQNKGKDIRWSLVKYRVYSEDERNPAKLRGKREADLVWIGANAGASIDIYYEDQRGDAKHDVKKRGTFLVKAFNAILGEIGADTGTCHNAAHRSCGDGSRYELVYHRMWDEKNAWYASFGYLPSVHLREELLCTKKNLLKEKLSNLYKIADNTGFRSDAKKWRTRLKARIAADLGNAVRDNGDNTLKDIMQAYIAKMRNDDAICQGYVKMMKILQEEVSGLKPWFDVVKTSNTNLYHGPYQ